MDNAGSSYARQRQVTLLETLDRLLNKGVVVAGDVTLSVADVDLIYVGLRLLISSVETSNAKRSSLSTERRKKPETLSAPESALAGFEGELGGRLTETLPQRINADPEKVEQGLVKLVLTVVELLRRLLEKQAMRRMDADSLTPAEIERVGLTFLRLEQKMGELKTYFGLRDEDLNLNLGPLGELM
ncbi:MAG: gas vesicle protein K [Acidobacteria bacterium]|nr:gas vesicle protein K [Acidobacteriota bacterium]